MGSRRLTGCMIAACGFWITTMAMGATDVPVRPWMNTSLSPDQRAELVLKAMTQDEKFRLIRSDFGEARDGKPMPVGALDSAGYVPAITRLGLPALQETDAGLGVARPDLSGKGATALPSGLATAASFDPQLAYAGGAMIGAEARRKGFNIMLAGGVDLQRDPRNGRNFEYAGEDPLLAGTIVGHAVQGIQSQQVIATIKHYAINALETGRQTLTSQIDPKAARESDLLAFEIAIGIGHPGSVMCAYNRVNGVYACENDWLLNQVLKHDWAYPGFVMSDWGAVHSAGESVLAGLDQESAGEFFDAMVYFDKPLRAAVASGEVPQARIDDMVRRILRSMFAVGVMDHPSQPGPLDAVADAAVAQRAEEAGAVLLRNEHDLLPLSPTLASIAVIGGHADRGVLTGGGSSAVMPIAGNAVPGLAPPDWPGPPYYQPSPPLAAINRRVQGKAQFNDGREIAAAAQLAAHSDVAVVFVEQWAAESFDLPDMMLGLAQRFRQETGIALDVFIEDQDLRIPTRVCREIFQIYKESLQNIKKHAKAGHVVVKLDHDETRALLVIDDNGEGFDFSGKYTGDELDNLRLGPISIKERARHVGGNLTLESNPGRGARLTIEIPLS